MGESSGKCILNIIRNCQAVFKVAVSFYIPPAHMRVPVIPHHCQHLALSVFHLYFFKFIHSDRYVIISHGFNLHFRGD